ncbi:MAG: flagellin [Nitrososphaerales archaeon]
MAFKIATNVASINTQRWLGVAQVGMNKALERLSSGYKINRAADDAAGIAIATKLNVKAVSVAKAIDNGNQAIAMLQTAESGIDQIAAILTRLKELATQAASDNVSDDDRKALDQERGALIAEIDKIAENTRYGDVALISGGRKIKDNSLGSELSVTNGIMGIDVSQARVGVYSVGVAVNSGLATVTLYWKPNSDAQNWDSQTLVFQVPSGFQTKELNFNAFGVRITVNSLLNSINAGAQSGFEVEIPQNSANTTFVFQLGSDNKERDQITVTLKGMSAAALTLTGNIETKSDAQAYMGAVEDAIKEVNKARATIGAAQNQITYHIANLEAMYENTRAAVSTIKDADFAREMAEFTKYQIITQSGIAMLAQANQLPQLILSLMR